MRYHALEIHVQTDNTALCFIQSPAFGAASPAAENVCQRMTLKDAENRVEIAVTGRKISIADARRIARQAVDRTFSDAW